MATHPRAQANFRNLFIKPFLMTLVTAMRTFGRPIFGWGYHNKSEEMLDEHSKARVSGSVMTWAHSYIYSAENLLEVEVPERAEYIRLIATEIQRVTSHLMWLGAYSPDIGNLTIFTWCLRDREMFIDLMQELGGTAFDSKMKRK